ncbi:phage polarity suppression protein [Erwinia sp. PK3-005]
MINAITPQDALSQYRRAGESWRTLRADRENKQQQLETLFSSEDKPTDYGQQADNLREWQDVLTWQIICAGGDVLQAHRHVTDACVNEALIAFMDAHGAALTGALAPYLNGPAGLETAMRTLRAAVIREAEISAPVVAEEYQAILNETGLYPDSAVRDDAAAIRTPARDAGYRFRLEKLNAQQEGR